MMFAAAVMHPVIGSLLVRAVEKARKARAEIVKMLQGFGCEQVGVMDNFDDCSVLLAFTHRGRQVQLCSSARGWAAMYLKKKRLRTQSTPTVLFTDAFASSEQFSGLPPARTQTRYSHGST
jgi:hypothetical protein